MNKKIIQLICPDQKGIISKLTSVLYKANHNILSIQQHIDKEKEKFYIRISVDVDSKNKFPEGWKAPKPYLRIVKQPKD